MSDLITNATGFVTLMGGLSLAVERTVETIKGFVPFLNEPITNDPKKDARRGAMVRLLAAIVGAFAAAGVQSQVTATAPVLSVSNIGFTSYIILGLLTSGGSAFWNHILDLLQAMKQKQAATPAPAAVPAAPVAAGAAAGKP